MAAYPWQAGGGSSQPASASNYWGNTNYATSQQAQTAGMPSQQNYQSPPGSVSNGSQPPLWQSNPSGGGYSYVGPGSTAATQAGSPWASPQQGAWGSPSGGGQTSQQQPPAQTNWGSGQGGWGQPQQPAQGQPPPSWWQQPQQGSYQQPAQGGTYVPDGRGGLIYWPPQQGPVFQPQGPQQGQQPPQQGGMQAPPPGHDTNGYQSPQAVQPPASRFAMPGWDNQKWNDPNNQDPKYVVGRILSNLPGRTDQMDTAVQRIQAAYPGSQRVGQGDIQIPGVGVIDILMKSSTGGSGWWWGAGGGGGDQKPAQQQSPYQTAGGGMDPYSQMLFQLAGAGNATRAQYAQPQQQAAAPVDVSQYTQQIQRLQTQLQELQAGQNQQRGLNVTYF